MKKERLSREQIEDQEDLKAHIAVMNDPNTEWVEWNQAKDEIHRWRKQNGYEVDEKASEAVVGAD